MAHPVRPDAYHEINNFYTVTVYEKGAEVVRMYQTLFGRDGFRKGMDLYFSRHDGNAVTCNDFSRRDGRCQRDAISRNSNAGTARPEPPASDWKATTTKKNGHSPFPSPSPVPPTPGQTEKQPF